MPERRCRECMGKAALAVVLCYYLRRFCTTEARLTGNLCRRLLEAGITAVAVGGGAIAATWALRIE